MTNKMIKDQLISMAEPEYQKFTSKLIPNIDSNSIIGVRLPKLRKVARQIVKEDWKLYLQQASDDTFEEVMLQGMVIGYSKTEPEEKLNDIALFIPKINNWSTCDSFCSGLKIANEYPDKIWDFILPYFNCREDYSIRFAIVMLICYYSNENYIEEAFKLLDGIKTDSYYVKMAIAWCISLYYVNVPDQTLSYLDNNNLDDFTYNKSLQKIIESLKVDKEKKDFIRTMKR